MNGKSRIMKLRGEDQHQWRYESFKLNLPLGTMVTVNGMHQMFAHLNGLEGVITKQLTKSLAQRYYVVTFPDGETRVISSMNLDVHFPDDYIE